MEVTRVNFSELSARGLWKVEFFCARKAPKFDHQMQSVVLADLVETRAEYLNPASFPNHTFNYLGLEHVQPLTGELIDFAPCKGADIRSRSKVFREGDILYGRLRPYLNKVFLALESVTCGICSGEFFILVPDVRRVRPYFLRALLASSIVQDIVANLQAGSTHPRLRLEDLLAIELPLPCIELQDRLQDFVVAETRRWRILAEEVRAVPAAVIEEVLSCLREGCVVAPQRPTITKREVVYENPLPGESVNGRSQMRLPGVK